MATYRLNESGKQLTWDAWKKRGGCGVSGQQTANVARTLGPVAAWVKRGVTLGDIAAASVVAERELARFTVEHFGRADLVVIERA